jgi:hypothetical protein
MEQLEQLLKLTTIIRELLEVLTEIQNNTGIEIDKDKVRDVVLEVLKGTPLEGALKKV